MDAENQIQKEDRFAKRFKALNGLTTSWQQKMVDNNYPSAADLVGQFSAFSVDYFDYINKLGDQDRLSRLNSGLSNLQTVWANISRACEQRQISDPEFQKQIQTADKQAQIYYDRFNDSYKTIPDPIVYFEKLFAITRYPFSAHALISIPIQFYDDPNQWQALAHELGHHIYWNSLPLKDYRQVHKDLVNQLVQVVKPSSTNLEQLQIDSHIIELWNLWLEETFADICGTMMAGVSYAQSSQELNLIYLPGGKSDEDVDESLSDHPSAYIRPLIPIAALEWIAEQSTQAKSLLGDRSDANTVIGGLLQSWNQCRSNQTGDCPFNIDGICIEKIEGYVKGVVFAILNFVWWGNDQGNVELKTGTMDSHPRLGDLFKYEAWLKQLPQQIENALVLEPMPAIVVRASKVEDFTLPLPTSNGAFRSLFADTKVAIAQDTGLTGTALEMKVLETLLQLELGDTRGLCGDKTTRTYRGVTTCVSC